MPYRRPPNGRDEPADDWLNEGPESVDLEDDGDETIPCPHCGRDVYEGAEQCPKCGKYLSDEDKPRRFSKLMWLGIILALLAGAAYVLTWVTGPPAGPY